MKRIIGLYFGSFNPVHIGHLILANHLVEHSDLDEIWFVVTPQNPFKEKKTLLDNANRLEMVSLCLKEYTFALIMGEDNLKSFTKWKNYETILRSYFIYVYPRISEGEVPELLKENEHIIYVKTPIIEISATAIREDIALDKNVKPLLPTEVWNYIDKWGFYK